MLSRKRRLNRHWKIPGGVKNLFELSKKLPRTLASFDPCVSEAYIYIFVILISESSEPPLSFESSTFQNKNCIVFNNWVSLPAFYPLLSFSLLCVPSQALLSCLAPADTHCDLKYSVLSFPYHGTFDSDTDGYIIDQILAAAHSLLGLH